MTVHAPRRVATVCILILLTAPCRADDREPSSGGKTATQWIDEFAKAESDIEKRKAIEILYKMGKPVVPFLIKGIQSDSAEKKNGCMQVAYNLGPIAAAVVPAVVELLKDKDKKIRAMAFGLLGQMGPTAKAAVPAMIEQFNDKDFRYQSGDAVGKIGKDAIPELRKFVDDKDPLTRETTVYAIMQVAASSGPGAKEALPELLVILKDKNRKIRSWAVSAVGSIGPDAKDAVPDLIEILKQRDLESRERAIQSLSQIGPNAKAAVPVLLEELKKATNKYTITTAIARIGADAQAVPVLIPLLKDKNPATPPKAAEALGKAGKLAKAAVPDLIDALKDKNAELRAAAAVALGEIGPDAKAAIPELIKMVKDSDYRVQNGAGTALKKLDPAAAKKAGVR